jgi:hypothetical protein
MASNNADVEVGKEARTKSGPFEKSYLARLTTDQAPDQGLKVVPTSAEVHFMPNNLMDSN